MASKSCVFPAEGEKRSAPAGLLGQKEGDLSSSGHPTAHPLHLYLLTVPSFSLPEASAFPEAALASHLGPSPGCSFLILEAKKRRMMTRRSDVIPLSAFPGSATALPPQCPSSLRNTQEDCMPSLLRCSSREESEAAGGKGAPCTGALRCAGRSP